jgi:chromosome segregation ATPase
MIDDTISKIEARINGSASIKEENRTELKKLLAELKSEIGELEQVDAEHAQSIAGYTDIFSHEATRTKQNPQLLENSMNGLSESVTGFEAKHPKLVAAVNRICHTLSNLGI